MKHLLPLLSLFVTTVSLAQPVLDNSIIAPLGATMQFYNSNSVGSFNPGTIGANQTWNYATLDTTSGLRSQKMVLADTTPAYVNFPSVVNRALEADAQFGTKAYSYAYLDNSKYEYYGFAALAGLRVYSNPQKQLEFPFTFNNQFTDYFYDEDSIFFGRVVVKADAYGTLILPTGTFSNVLRINVKEDYREHTDWDFDDEPIDSTMYDGQYYRWYLPNSVSPLLEYSRLVSYVTYLGVRYDVDSLKHLVINKNALPTSVNDPQNSFVSFVYPNPVNHLLTVNAETPIEKMMVTDVCGKVLHERNYNEQIFTVDFENYAAGTYFLHMVATDGRRSSVKVLHL